MAKPTHKEVKFSAAEMAEEPPIEVDYSQLNILGRGTKAIEAMMRRKVVPLDPDVAKLFPTAKEINDTLRLVAQLRHIGEHKKRKIS